MSFPNPNLIKKLTDEDAAVQVLAMEMAQDMCLAIGVNPDERVSIYKPPGIVGFAYCLDRADAVRAWTIYAPVAHALIKAGYRKVEL